MKKTFEFIKKLSANNNREWFNAHKDEYLEVKGEVEAFTSKLIAALSEIDPEVAMLKPSDCLYRIYRDTRFSPDKTPYKTHIGIYVSAKGKKSEWCGYYVHLEPGNCLVCGGAWCPPAPLLKVYRKEIYDNIEEYLEIIRNPEFVKAFGEPGEDFLKTAPKGFPKDWEYIDLLKPKTFTVYAPLPDGAFEKSNIIGKVVSLFKTMKPFLDFLNYTFEEHPELLNCRPPRRR